MAEPRAEFDDTDEQECGYVYDHDIEVTHEDETGIYWVCRRCGAEGFPDDEDWPAGVVTPPGNHSDQGEVR